MIPANDNHRFDAEKIIERVFGASFALLLLLFVVIAGFNIGRYMAHQQQQQVAEYRP